MTRKTSFHFGRKLFFALLLSTIGGFGWAMWETGTKPRSLLEHIGRVFQPLPPEETPSASPEPSASGSPSRTPKPTRSPGTKPSPSPSPTSLSPALASLIEEIEKSLRAGKIAEAHAAHSAFDPAQIRPEELPAFQATGQRLARLAALLAETPSGTVSPPADLAQVFLPGGAAQGLLVRDVTETPTDLRFETLDGTRSKVKKADALVNRVAKAMVEATLDGELERRAGVAGIKVDWEMTPRGRLMKLEPYPGTRVEAVAVFELAEFCARNGAAKRIVPLFEEALRIDAGVAQAVHAGRAEATADALIYQLSMRDRDNAKRSYALLKDRYGDSPAYREKIEGDADLKKLLLEVLAGEAIAVAPTPRPTPSTSPPASPSPSPSGTPEASPAPSPSPTQEPPPTPEPEVESPLVEGASSGPTILPDDAPAKAKELCAKGDEDYAKAFEHLQKANPSTNPRGYHDENRKALEYLDRAFQSYNAAQDLFGSSVPPALIKRFRDTQMTRSFCRKRSVRH